MNESNSKADRHLPLHPLDLRILLALIEGARHGYDIVKSIEARERTPTRIYPANLYRRLRDLLRKGLIEEAEPPEKMADERRHYFLLSPLGLEVVELEASRLQDLLSEVREKRLLIDPGSVR